MDVELKSWRHDESWQYNNSDRRIKESTDLWNFIEGQQDTHQSANPKAMNTDLVKESNDGCHYYQRVNDHEELQQIIIQVDTRTRVK